MNRFEKEFRYIREWSSNEPYLAHAEAYIATGDVKALKGIKKVNQKYWLSSMTSAINAPDRFDKMDVRAIEVLIAGGCIEGLADWLNNHLRSEGYASDYCGVLRGLMLERGVKEEHFLKAVAAKVFHYDNEEQLTSAGRYLLSLSPALLKKAFEWAVKEHMGLHVLHLVATYDDERLDTTIFKTLMSEKDRDYIPVYCAQLLENTGDKFLPQIVATFKGEKKLGPKLSIGWELCRYDMKRFGEDIFKLGKKALHDKRFADDAEDIACNLMKLYGAKALPEAIWVAGRGRGAGCWAIGDLFQTCVEEVGNDAIDVLKAGLDSEDARVWLKALTATVSLKNPDLDDLLYEQFQNLGEGTSVDQALAAMDLAVSWNRGRMEPDLWNLLTHRSKQVREKAARILVESGARAIPGAVEYLAHKKADVRITAVGLLARIDSPKVVPMLQEKLEKEENDDVRDAIYLALDQLLEASGEEVSMKDMQKRINRARKNLAKPPAKWVKIDKLPKLQLTTGKKLTDEQVAYLLYRQSRCKGVQLDIESKPLVKMIDRKTSGEFAAALWNGFVADGADTKQRWAIALAGLLGDDTLAPKAAKQAEEWAKQGRTKLAEYGVQVLGLMGSDVALMALDTMSIRFRTKTKILGRVSAECFRAVADARGVSVEELGDRVVPWLGFEPGKPRLIDAGGRKIEVTVGPNLKLRYFDLEKNKVVKSLPKAVGPEIKKEFKELAATLREAIKAQTFRLENMMVQQYRWTLDRWKVLFCNHPILRPFGISLIWGAYDAKGELISALRLLDDGTFTDQNDTARDLSGADTMGILHPLELSEDDRHKWKEHLADYEVDSPFPQIQRAAVFVADKDKAKRRYEGAADTTLNAMTFKGRAERLGWARGSVCDGGGITFYYKPFPRAGLDFLLYITGMYIGVDMYSEVTLQDGHFVKAGSVDMGSYVYDEPKDDKDERVVPFGELPPVVFSEVMGDLQKITAKKQAAAED